MSTPYNLSAYFAYSVVLLAWICDSCNVCSASHSVHWADSRYFDHSSHANLAIVIAD
jgi:hypothetical protein